MTLSQVEKKILNDNRSGSSEIFGTTVKYILEYLNRHRLTEKQLSHINGFNRAVVDRFSSMALVRNGLKQVENILSDFDPRKRNKAEIVSRIEAVLSEFHDIDEKIIKNCRDIFKKKVKVSTYSQSGLVKKVLAHYRKKLKSVTLSEARPAMEGIPMAAYLSGLDIHVELCVDMFLPELMPGADYFIIGADWVGPDFFVNKIGTAALLKAARESGLKNVVLYESLKETKRNPRISDIRKQDGAEIYNGRKGRRIEIVNRYFEVIPNRLVHKFISDRKIYASGSLRRHIKTAGR